MKTTHPIRAAVLTGAAVFAILAFCLLVAGSTRATSADFGYTETFLGQMRPGDGEEGLDSHLDMPHGLTISDSGNFYIADTYNNAIRRWGADDIVSTYAGTGEYGHSNGSRGSTEWAYPKGITTADDGTMYVADTSNHLIRKIDGDTVTDLPIPGLALPTDIEVDGSTVYIVDAGNNRVVKAGTDGSGLTTLATGLNQPFKIVKIGSYLYVTEFGAGEVKKINASTGATTTLADGFTQPRAIANVNGSIYITAGPNGVENELWKINASTGDETLLKRRREDDTFNSIAEIQYYNDRIYMLGSGGSSIYSVETDGTGLTHLVGKDRFGNTSGNRSDALLGRPQDVVFSADGSKMFISYAQGNKLALYHFTTGKVEFIAGWVRDSYTEGTGDDARFSDVTQMALSPDGTTLYVVDRNNNRIRKVTLATKATSYLTGAGGINATGSSDNGYQEGGPCDEEYDTGVSGCAYFNRPTGLAISPDGTTLYVADAGNNRVRSVTIATGQTALIAGSGSTGFTDGVGSTAKFNGPYSLAISTDGRTLYLSDKSNNALRQIDISSKRVTTLAGTGSIGYREGSFASAVLAIPENVRLGPDGALYVSEAGSLRFRRFDLATRTSMLVSGDGDRGVENGEASVASWDAPKGFDFSGGYAYVADFRNDLIRRVALSGAVSPLDTIRTGTNFFAYDSSLRGGWNVDVGDVSGDSTEEIITGTGVGFAPQVRVFNGSGTSLSTFYAYDVGLRTGVRVAACDFADRGKRIVTVPGPGERPSIRRFTADGEQDGGFDALDGQFRGGAYIACGEVNGIPGDEIIIAAGRGGGAQVTVHAYDGTSIANFFAYNQNTFRGGIVVATGDTDGDGREEIITGPEYGAPHIQFFSLQPGRVKQLNPGFYAFDPGYRGGVYVETIDADKDGKNEFMIGVGIDADPHVKIYNKTGTTILDEFRPYAREVTGGLRLAAGDVDGDGEDEIVVMPRSGGGPQVRVIESEL